MPAVYQITVKGHLDSQWSAWFDNMMISHEANGEAVLCGPLPDQSALYGVLIKIRDLGLPLLAVTTIARDETCHDTVNSAQKLHTTERNHDEQSQQEVNDEQ
jgi:hypothetical protein